MMTALTLVHMFTSTVRFLSTFDELDNFQLGEQQDLSVPLSKNVTKLSMATDLDDGPETAVKG